MSPTCIQNIIINQAAMQISDAISVVTEKKDGAKEKQAG